MKITWELIYIYALVFAGVLSLILTRLSIPLGKRCGLMDHPGARKVHAEPKPLSGGAAIFTTFILTIFLHFLVWELFLKESGLIPDNVAKFLANVHTLFPKMIAILIGSTLMFGMGLRDDKKPLPPMPKLAIQIFAGAILFFGGIKIRVFVDSEIASFIITIVWVVALTNSFNFLDNMDGLSAGVAAIVSVNFAIISIISNEYFMVIVYMIFIGSLLGFLKYNFNPSRVFMGDSGSLFIGFVIAAFSILSTYYDKGVPTRLPVVTPLIILGLPLFDTVSVMLIRLKNKKPLMVGDKNHFSHRLVALGMSHRGAVVFIYLITFIIGLNALPLRKASFVGGLVILTQTVLLFVIIFLLEHVGKSTIMKNSGGR